MIPRPRLIWLFAAAGVPLVVSVWAPELVRPSLLSNLVVVAAALADLLLTTRTRTIDVRREVSEVLSVGVPHAVILHVTNRSPARLTLEVTDEPPRPSDARPLPLRFELPPWKEMAGTYELVPRRRGHHVFEAVHLRYPSRLGLWMKMERRPLETRARVYPDIRAVREFDLLARKNRLEEMGLKAWRLRGRGGEFERLREFRREDELRDVDWKATAKHQKLITREFNVERNQNIVFMLDCGRSMTNESEGLSHLDRGLNAAIILSYIALGQGDNVALMAFSNRIERAAGPVRGKPAIQTLIRQTFDLEPRLEASDYAVACEDLLRRQRKRALVVLITHALDEQHLLSIGRYVPTLVRPHILLCVFLKDVALTELARRVPQTDLEAFHVAAAAEMLESHARRTAELQHSGVLVLETLPNELSSALINQYLDLKARHLL